MEATIHSALSWLVLLLVGLFVASQLLYTLTFIVDFYFLSLPVNWVDMEEPIVEPESQWPYIVLFYPVLRELEATMRTTFLSLSKVDYPRDRCRVVAIPNSSDEETIAGLRRLMTEFAFLELLIVPPTSDPSWQIVWDAWEANPKAYWWHRGKRARVKDLPPKKTRQLVYALYHTAQGLRHEPNLVIDYIDADSCPPADHFKGAVIGLKRYDVLQALNVAGNLNETIPASWHAFDHMAWDGYKYPHLSANGKQPYWVLGKGLFYRVSDLLELGGFHPWITIEDPEIGLRYWSNKKRLGILASSLIEEVPRTWLQGVTQRKRWICGFFQTLGGPLGELGLSPWERFKCWLLFFPCLSLFINVVGIPTGIWAAWMYFARAHVVPQWTMWVALLNVTLFALSMSTLYAHVWKRTRLVLTRWGARVWYMLRVNPLSMMAWWILWIVPLTIGLWMYLRDEGLAWQRTEKIDANKLLIRRKIARLEPARRGALASSREDSKVE
jgi:cellulose synthase/poly-beta-1,6-N-acetylglucosamine synthase-like glycosyltransferase